MMDSISVGLKTSMRIPANSQLITKVPISTPCFSRPVIAMTEVPSGSSLPGGILVASWLVQLFPNVSKQDLLVEIRNVGWRNITIPSGTELCTLQQCCSTMHMDDAAESSHEDDYLGLFQLGYLSEVQKVDLHALLMKWRHVFSITTDMSDMGKASLVEHPIKLNDETTIKQRHQSIPPALYSELRQHLEELADSGIVRESQSPWASPLVLARRSDGSLRMCIDFRKSNQCTIKDSYCMPRIEETMEALYGAKFFTCLNLKSGYYQVEMSEEDRAKTAFTAGPLGFFELTRMAFGLTNAPATYQRLMEKCLHGLQPHDCLGYLDDIIVHSSTMEENLQRLELVFESLSAAGLKLKPNKCQFLSNRVKYLDHVISERGIETDAEKVECLKKWPVPLCVENVRRFLGFSGYYRRFDKDYGKLAKPLTNLLKGTR